MQAEANTKTDRAEDQNEHTLRSERNKAVLCWLHYLVLVICYGTRETVGEKDSDQLDIKYEQN